jgi:S1-C subfamily serine protease
MSEPIKGNCIFCGGEIVFQESDVGRVVECPHCKRSMEVEAASAPSEATGLISTIRKQPSGFPYWKFVLAACVVLIGVVAIGIVFFAEKKADAQRISAEIAQMKAEQERLRAEADVAKAEAERAKAEVELTRAKLKEEEDAKAAEKARADALAQAAERTDRREIEEKQRLLDETKERLKNSPAVWALWEEQDHNAVRILATRPADATLRHKGASVVAKYNDMPDWLKTAAQTRHQLEGEAKGLIREVNGKTYDLRTSPPGWLMLPLSEVIQLVADGYLMRDVASIGQPNGAERVFKLKHNGLMRVMNVGERVQLVAMSSGTYNYENKRLELMRVPIYDPGMPVGRLRDRMVPMNVASIGMNRPKHGPNDPKQRGSGFFVSEDGLFITNAHVVEDYTKIEVRTAAGTKKATVLRVDKDKDLALLRVAEMNGATALRVATNSPSIGTHVFTIGYPLVDLQGSQPKFTDGKVSSVAGAHDNPDDMQISVAVQPGNSGGPLADANGDVVGVVVASLDEFETVAVAGAIPQMVNYAVKATTLARFFRENRALVWNVRLGKSAQRTQEDAIRTVERASAMVLVYE